MDFKAALLKRQPSATTGNVFKPTTGDASTNGKKEQDGRPTIPFNAPEDEGRDAAMKVGWRFILVVILDALKFTNVCSISACATALEDVTWMPVRDQLGPCSTSICYLQL